MSPPRCWRYPSTSPALPAGGRRHRRRATLLPRPAMICTRPPSAVLRSESSSRRPIPAAAVRRRGKGATGEARIARRSLAAAEARVAAPNRLEVHVRKRRAAVSPQFGGGACERTIDLFAMRAAGPKHQARSCQRWTEPERRVFALTDVTAAGFVLPHGCALALASLELVIRPWVSWGRLCCQLHFDQPQ